MKSCGTARRSFETAGQTEGGDCNASQPGPADPVGPPVRFGSEDAQNGDCDHQDAGDEDDAHETSRTAYCGRQERFPASTRTTKIAPTTIPVMISHSIG